MTLRAPATAPSIAASHGLSASEAQRLRAEVGPNVIAEDGAPPWRVLLGKFWSPVAWMLEGAVVLQLVLGEYADAAVVGALLTFNAMLGFLQENSARAAVATLKGRLAPTALVCRDGVWSRRPAAELVPGDAIRLTLGALVPADARLSSGSLLVDQSSLTGESAPVEADSGATVFTGAVVRRGEATAEVTATGARTRFGRAAALVRLAHSTSTEHEAIVAATRTLALINGALALLVVGAGRELALPTPDLVGLVLTALLASVPVALPATFTLSGALTARKLAQHGALLTRLSAAHEAAAMDLLCSDKTGTLTRAALTVQAVAPRPGFLSERVITLATLACSEGDQDPIDSAIRSARPTSGLPGLVLESFTPFDPVTRISEAVGRDERGHALRVVKGALAAVQGLVPVTPEARREADRLENEGNRVIAIAAGSGSALELAGFVALGDPPREDAAKLIVELRELGVRTVMITGDSALTAAAVAHQVGIDGPVCPSERLATDPPIDDYGVFARVLPEQKYAIVSAAQRRRHVVGMCGDGVNDAPALRQAQLGIAVASATDAAKSAASLVLTEPGLYGIVFAVREGRVAFQRLQSYALNMLVKKLELVLFLAVGLWLTGVAIMTPELMVLLLVTNDFLSMSLTTDRTRPAPAPRTWRMRRIAVVASVIALCKLGFSSAVLAMGRFVWHLEPGALRTLAFVTLVLGNQAVVYVVRERGRFWSSRPSSWVLASTVLDLTIASGLALSGTLMEPIAGRVMLAVLLAAAVFAVLLDRAKLAAMTLASLD